MSERERRTVPNSYLKTVLRMAWPVVLEYLFQALAGIIDSFMVSSMGTAAVASVGLSEQPKYTGLMLFLAVNVAVSAVVARRKGEDDREGANRALYLAVTFCLVFGTLVSVLCVLNCDWIISFCGSNEETHGEAVVYAKIILGGMLFNILSLAINAAQRGVGNVKIAMRANITSAIVNVCFNYLLINGHLGFPALKIRGAAIATVLGTAVACGMSFWSICKKDSYLNVPFTARMRHRFAATELRPMIRLTCSNLPEQLIARFSFTALGIMAAHQGTLAFSAHQISNNLSNITFQICCGLQVAVITLVGQSLGRKRNDEADIYVKICGQLGIGVSVVISLILAVGGHAIFHLFFQEAEAIDIGARILIILAAAVPLRAFKMNCTGCLCGGGDVLYPSVVGVCSMVVFHVGLGYLLCYRAGLGIHGIWLGMLTDQFAASVLMFLRLKKNKWKTISI